MSKNADDAIGIIDRKTLNDHQRQHNKGSTQKKAGIIELGTNDAILAQNKLLSQQVEELMKQMSKLPQQLKEMHELLIKHQQVVSWVLCNGDHPIGYCPSANEEVNYMGNQNHYQ